MTTVEAKPSPAGVPGAVTDTSGLQAEELTFTGSGGTAVNGYLASPAGTEPCAGMIVIHEAGGLNEHIRDICNRLAALGYSALGVDLYTREGGPPPAGDVEAIMKRLFSMSDETVRGDLDGAADHLRGLARASGRVGCIGFCMGGRYTLLMAVTSDRLDAAVDCWGGFIDRATPDRALHPRAPHSPARAGRSSCTARCWPPWGPRTTTPRREIAEQLRERAAASGQEVEVDVYEGAGHAFFADYRPTYRPEPAARLWERIVPFLSRHLQEA